MEQAKEKNRAIEMYMMSNVMGVAFDSFFVKSSFHARYQGISHDSI